MFRQVRLDAVPCLNRVPHVTVLHAPGVPPKTSNAVLEALEDAERDAVRPSAVPAGTQVPAGTAWAATPLALS